jgi:hypothetical protein
VAVLAGALAWAMRPWPCPLADCLPLLFDEGVLLREALELATRPDEERAQTTMGRPLHRILVAGAIRIAGPVPWAGALVSTLAGALGLAVVFGIGRIVGGARVGLLSAVILATGNLYAHYSRTALAEIDSLLFFLLALRSVLTRAQRARIGHGSATSGTEEGTESGPASGVPVRGGWLLTVPAGLWLGLAVATNPRIVLCVPWLLVAGLSWPDRARHLRTRLGLLASLAVLAAFELVPGVAVPGSGTSFSGFGVYLGIVKDELFSPSGLLDYPIFAIVFEGPVLLALAGLGMARARALGGVAATTVVAGPVAAAAFMVLAYRHHALRYLAPFLPALALAGAVGAAGLLVRVRERGPAGELAIACAAGLVVVPILSLTRVAAPSGHVPGLRVALEEIRVRPGSIVLASSFPGLSYLLSGRRERVTVLPPVRSRDALAKLVRAGAAFYVLDFQRWFLGDYSWGELAPEVLRAHLAARLAPRVIPNPAARGPYIWFEHGVTDPPTDRGRFDAIEIYDLRGSAIASEASARPSPRAADRPGVELEAAPAQDPASPGLPVTPSSQASRPGRASSPRWRP